MVDFMLKKPQDIINFWLAYKCDAINIHAIKNCALIITTKGQGSVFCTSGTVGLGTIPGALYQFLWDQSDIHSLIPNICSSIYIISNVHS